MSFKTSEVLVCCALLTAISSGCASMPSMTSHNTVPSRDGIQQVAAIHVEGIPESPTFRANNHDCGHEELNATSQIEFGRPVPLIDGIGWFFGIPEKILLWDRRATNHNVSPETAQVVQSYLQQNGLNDVKVRVNQYAPGSEWRRLRDNKAVSPLWRYTFGAVGTIGYTLIPGRLFGTDNYNPFTNTVSIYSDIPSVAVHEAAYAKDNRSRSLPGTYGFAQQIAGINIYHETKASQFAHRWLQTRSSPELVAESNRILPPLYGLRVGGSLGDLTSSGSALPIVGAIAGHAVSFGRSRLRPVASTDTAAVGIVPASYSSVGK